MFGFNRLREFATLFLVSNCLVPAIANEPKLKVLLVCGGCCHDYTSQKQILSQGLTQRISAKVDIVHEGDNDREHKLSVYAKPNWWKGYDLVIHDECFGQVTDPDLIASILAAHYDGTPAVFLHCAMHSYRNSGDIAEKWRELIGVTSVKHEKGGPSERVVPLVADHPVMKGFPAVWQTPHGELYEISKVWPNCTPLAEATSNSPTKKHPVIWTNTLGKSRIFGTTLGHSNETVNTPEYLGVVARGALWTLDKLSADGTPVAGYAGTGISDIVIEKPVLKPMPDASVK